MRDIVLPRMKRAAQIGVDKQTTFAKLTTRQRIQAAGLGRLAGAVGSQSSLRNRRLGYGVATGVIYARGKADSRANQALLAYSEGASIFPTGGKEWLAFPTNAIPKRVGPKKMTPALYRASGLVQTIGKLAFIQSPGNSKEAFLIAKKVTQSRRTGRAKAFAGRVPRGADKKDSVIAFILIRFTIRARRFNQKAIMMLAQRGVPAAIAEAAAGGR